MDAHGECVGATVKFRRVNPLDYRLFQAADLFCTLELLRAKVEDNALAR